MRIVTFAALACGLALSGCDSFDPLDKFQDWDLLSSKTPIKGDRKDVFPQGVPGVPQGVPPEMVKGYQPPPEPPPVAEAKPDRKMKGRAAAEAAPPPPSKQARRKAAPPQAGIEPGDQPMRQAPAAGNTTQTQPVQPAPGGFQTMPGAQPTWPSNAQPVP